MIVMINTPNWIKFTLKIAAIYNVLYAILLSIFPVEIFNWLKLPSTSPIIIQCLGMMVGVYGLAYWIAGQNPVRYWPLILVGIVGKTLGPIGGFYYALSGELPWHALIMLLCNDLIWWIPFWIILVWALRKEYSQ